MTVSIISQEWLSGRTGCREGSTVIAPLSGLDDSGALQINPSADGTGEVVPLPKPGEVVWLTGQGEEETCRGVWVGTLREAPAATVPAELSARVLVDGQLRMMRGPACRFDARRVVLGDGEVPPAEMLAGLAQLSTLLDQQAAEHQSWREEMAAAAHEKAEAHDLCGVFDAFMADWGLPGRTRTWAVCVDTSESVTLYVQANSQEEAENSVTSDQVDAARSAYTMNWTVTHCSQE
ncbi:hypothetical protein [Klenkia sp. PcliD-1-E]|uniref:hypothetical protein n=1 Tax=Klenkia sp. PcliD-1-E TaxID=2954492 RepID=UPI0020974B64|nr:hypothetical protein [Klenkia sp. PcliD-1-E]MCO7221555.1 hypothetical protein [Klenkia sp. PcliD-1-E]